MRAHVGPGNIAYVDEIALLTAVLEDPGRVTSTERAPEDARDTGVRRVAGHARPVHVVVAQRSDGHATVLPDK